MAYVGRRRAVVLVTLAGTAAAAIATAIGCSIYSEALLVPAPSDDGGVDVADALAPPDGPAPTDPCEHVFPPARPAKDDGPGDLTFLTALRTLDIGIRDDGGAPPSLGFDLDHACTCFAYPDGGGAESCKPRVAGATHCDDDAGRDNSGGELVRTLASISQGSFSQQTINDNIDRGVYGLMIKVDHYNGLANDTQVTVAIYVSNGTRGADGGGNPGAVWNGMDIWSLDSESVLAVTGGVPIPNFFDTNAYVANGVLVGKIDFPLSLGGGSGAGLVTLDLTGGFFVGEIKHELTTYRLDNGTVAGRWATKKLLAALGALHVPGSTTDYLCPVGGGASAYNGVKSLICKAADILADPTATDMSLQCDGLSIGFGFTAYPAQIGPVEPHVVRQTCPDAGPDDCP